MQPIDTRNGSVSYNKIDAAHVNLTVMVHQEGSAQAIRGTLDEGQLAKFVKDSGFKVTSTHKSRNFVGAVVEANPKDAAKVGQAVASALNKRGAGGITWVAMEG